VVLHLFAATLVTRKRKAALHEPLPHWQTPHSSLCNFVLDGKDSLAHSRFELNTVMSQQTINWHLTPMIYLLPRALNTTQVLSQLKNSAPGHLARRDLTFALTRWGDSLSKAEISDLMGAVSDKKVKTNARGEIECADFLEKVLLL
jgi:hypothetical protein